MVSIPDLRGLIPLWRLGVVPRIEIFHVGGPPKICAPTFGDAPCGAEITMKDNI